MSEKPEPLGQISEGELARVHIELIATGDRPAALVAEASSLHAELVELHAVLVEPLVELDRLLRDAHKF